MAKVCTHSVNTLYVNQLRLNGTFASHRPAVAESAPRRDADVASIATRVTGQVKLGARGWGSERTLSHCVSARVQYSRTPMNTNPFADDVSPDLDNTLVERAQAGSK